MKKAGFLILIIFFNVSVYSQTRNADTYLLSNVANTFGFGAISVLDPYLSPLQYNGIGLKYDNDNLRFLDTEKLNLSRQSKFTITAAEALNPAFTSLMMLVGANYQYGMYYHFQPISDLKVLAGGSCDVDFAVKYLPRNTNNPVNMDMSTNLNISAMAFYKLKLLKRDVQLQLSLQSPLLGCMFVPQTGASYYELFLLGNLTDAFHFSSLHNKRGFQSRLLLHVPFMRSNWHVGFDFNMLKYSANGAVYKKDDFGLVVGTTFDMISFSGRKNLPPSNFKSITE